MTNMNRNMLLKYIVCLIDKTNKEFHNSGEFSGIES